MKISLSLKVQRTLLQTYWIVYRHLLLKFWQVEHFICHQFKLWWRFLAKLPQILSLCELKDSGRLTFDSCRLLRNQETMPRCFCGCWVAALAFRTEGSWSAGCLTRSGSEFLAETLRFLPFKMAVCSKCDLLIFPWYAFWNLIQCLSIWVQQLCQECLQTTACKCSICANFRALSNEV